MIHTRRIPNLTSQREKQITTPTLGLTDVETDGMLTAHAAGPSADDYRERAKGHGGHADEEQADHGGHGEE